MVERPRPPQSEWGKRLAIAREIRKNQLFLKDVAFCQRHRDEVYQQYPGEYVAIFRRRIVAHGDNIDELLPQLTEHKVKLEDIYLWKAISREEEAEGLRRMQFFRMQRHFKR